MKLVQTVMKCLATHSESVARPIRDALAPLKAAILSQSLATLFELVDETFAQDEKKGAVIVEKVCFDCLTSAIGMISAELCDESRIRQR